jgi:DNA repair protein RecN (Recombination protein N)
MLTELTISNLAIIERQSLAFHPRFNVISGETGAGKSIILSALEFILGGKLSTQSIRQGADALEVQALFDLSDVPQSIKDELPDIVEGDELVVSRTLPREGRGKILINGRLGTASLLEEIVRNLVNICSQHHHTKLLDSKYHLEFLDGFCAVDSLKSEVAAAYRAWSEKSRSLAELVDGASALERRRQELEEIAEELGKLSKLRAGRREQLESEIRRLSNAERLIELGERVTQGIAAEGALIDQLREVSTALHEMERLDPAASSVGKTFEGARIAVLESEREIARYVSSIDIDGQVLEELRTELSAIARLERKYRTNDEGLATLRDKTVEQLQSFSGPNQLGALEAEVELLRKKLEDGCKKLHKSRVKAAKELCILIAKDLHELNMRDAIFDVSFTDAPPATTGTDRIEFIISTNRGEPLKPLVQIASGGELSRVMLVLKKILRERSGVNVLIFDEVDSGVSGGVARAVGVMLSEISLQSQVVCITHLPQVASLSDRHFLVNKKLGERAITVVRQLSEEEKVDEIARMLAGYQITDTARASARELIASKS